MLFLPAMPLLCRCGGQYKTNEECYEMNRGHMAA